MRPARPAIVILYPGFVAEPITTANITRLPARLRATVPADGWVVRRSLDPDLSHAVAVAETINAAQRVAFRQAKIDRDAALRMWRATPGQR